MILSENIKKFRKEAGLTQKALANKSGLSFSMISKLESGDQSNPSFETIKKISDVLKISPAELIDDPVSIEDQIDEYIEYKRGLNRKINSNTDQDQSEDRDEPVYDLNFRKKLQAINTIPKPEDNLDDELLKNIKKRPEMRKLFTSLRNASKSDIEQIIKIFEVIK